MSASRHERRRRWLVWTALGLFIVAVALTAAEAQRRSSLYWYDVRQDHRYQFSASRSHSVTVDETGVVLPPLREPGSTAMVSLRISTTLAGRWFEPALEIVAADGKRRVQYFERGAKGLRWVNLEGVCGATDGEGGRRLELRGRHVRWAEQESQLLLFAAPPLDGGPLLVIAPHPDDAEIAAFGLYATHDSWVVTVTAGNKPDSRLDHLVADPASQSLLVGELRAWDSVAVPGWGGVAPARAMNLGYFTLTLDRMYAAPDQVVADHTLETADLRTFRRVDAAGILEDHAARSTWASLVEDLTAILRAVRPRTIVSPDPRLDAAFDHKLTTIALFEALQQVEPARRTLLLYTNHHPDSEYFPFGPAEGVVSLPPWTRDPLWARGVLSYRLDEEQRTRKLIALEAQHDLRPPPRYVGASPIGRVLGRLGRTSSELWRDPSDSYSYFRRGPRPNELFLVVDEEDASRLRSEVAPFLARLRTGAVAAPDETPYRP